MVVFMAVVVVVAVDVAVAVVVGVEVVSVVSTGGEGQATRRWRPKRLV